MNAISIPTAPSAPLLGLKLLALSDFFSEATVAQDYPAKGSTSPSTRPSKPRVSHESYTQAQREGFLFGLRTRNIETANWTRLILFKPSKRIAAAWNFKIGNSEHTRLASFGFSNHTSGNILVSAKCASGICEAQLGFISTDDLKALKKAAWTKSLNEAL